MQLTFNDVIATEIEAALSLIDDEPPFDIRNAYTEASASNQKKADRILLAIAAIYDDTELEEDEKQMAIFAKALKLDTILVLC